MRKIAINYLHYRRDGKCHRLTFESLAQAKRLSEVKVNILVNNDVAPWKSNWGKMLRNAGAEVEVVHFAEKSAKNYTDKIAWATKQPEEYSVKLDEDVFVNGHVWDYMIENVDCLQNPSNFVVLPLLSNGIPSVDLFAEDFLDKDELKELYSRFVQFKHPNRWNFNYEDLNSSEWDWRAYMEKVRAFNTPVKGIHPVRMHGPSQYYINEMVLKHVDQFRGCGGMRLDPMSIAYFCNSFFLIRTEVWKSIFEDEDRRWVGKDKLGGWAYTFDEVPMNHYMREHDMNAVFIRNGFAVHTMYNTLYQLDGKSRGHEAEFIGKLHKEIFGE
jgi:hypothetical protein